MTEELIDRRQVVIGAGGGLAAPAALSRRRDPDPLDELTEREREVLALIAEGLTDRGIGERLWISTNTVETHVRHILQKLNLRHDDARNRRVQAVLIQLSN